MLKVGVLSLPHSLPAMNVKTPSTGRHLYHRQLASQSLFTSRHRHRHHEEWMDVLHWGCSGLAVQS